MDIINLYRQLAFSQIVSAPPTGYTGAIAITIHHTMIDADLTDWTFVVDQNFASVFTNTNGILDADGTNPMLADGGDLIVSTSIDGLNRIPIDPRALSTNNDPLLADFEIACKIPFVSSSVDTTFYILWGGTGTSQQYPLIIDNTNGQILQEHTFSVYLSESNYDFDGFLVNGDDIEIYDGAIKLPHWFEYFDSVNKKAKIWFKHSVGADTTTEVSLRISNTPTYNQQPNDTFIYFNALASVADMNDLNLEDGSAVWSIEDDAQSPTGKALNMSISAANQIIKYKDLSLPSEYKIHLSITQQGTYGSWIGGLLGMTANNQYRITGNKTGSGANGVQVRRNISGTFTNESFDTKSECLPAVGAWVNQVSHLGKSCELVGSTQWAGASVQQGVCYDSLNGLVIVTSSDKITSYNKLGVVQETIADISTGTSWGDCYIKDGVFYAVRFDSTDGSYIYSYTPANLSGGETLVKNISADMDTGANGLVWDGLQWIVSETDISSTNMHLYFYDVNWNYTGKIVVPNIHAGVGIQGIEIVENDLYLVLHSDVILRGRWDAVNKEFDMNNVITITGASLQSIAWDFDEGIFYINDRVTNQILVRIIEEHSVNSDFFLNYKDEFKSVGVAVEREVSGISANKIGLGGYRSGAFSQMFVASHTFKEPLVSLGSLEETAQPAPADTYGQYNAYDSGYKFVTPNGAGTDDRTISPLSFAPQGGITVGGITGQVGAGTNFDGNDDHTQIGSFNNKLTLGNSDVTVEMLAKPTGTGDAFQRIIDKSNSGGSSEGWGVYMYGSSLEEGLYFYVDTTAAASYVAVDAIKTGQWAHYALVHKNNSTSGQAIYVDGVSKPLTINAVRTNPSANAETAIGSWNHSTGREYKGGLNELRVSNTVRSPSWIQANHDNQMNTVGFLTITQIN